MQIMCLKPGSGKDSAGKISDNTNAEKGTNEDITSYIIDGRREETGIATKEMLKDLDPIK